MRPRARLLPAALADLTAIARWIAEEARSQRVALAFVARLRERCDEIAALPGSLGRQREDLAPDLRSLAWRDYVILFRYVGGRVQVIRILHGQRDLPRLVTPPADPQS